MMTTTIPWTRIDDNDSDDTVAVDDDDAHVRASPHIPRYKGDPIEIPHSIALSCPGIWHILCTVGTAIAHMIPRLLY